MGRKRKSKWKTKAKKYVVGLCVILLLIVLGMTYGVDDINETINSISNTAQTISNSIMSTLSTDDNGEGNEVTSSETTVSVERKTRNAHY